MADSRVFPDASLQAFANVLGNHPVFSNAPADEKRQIAENFEVWVLGRLDRAVDAEGRLVAVDTGYLHHQIRAGHKARAYARSQWNDSSQLLDLRAVGTSRISEKLRTVIEWVDDRTDTDGEIARLLTIPSRFIEALWLISPDRDRLILVHKLSNRAGPAYKHLYTPAAFVVAVLRSPRSFHQALR